MESSDWAPGLLTCDWCLYVQHGLLLAQDGSALAHDAECHRLLHSALLGEVSFQQVDPRLALTVEHLLRGQAVTEWEGDS